MARQMPGRNQDGVETQLEFGMFGMRHQPGLRRLDDARLLARRHRIGGVIEAGAGLDLDEGHQVAPPRHDVDLAIGRAKTLCQDAIALGHQKSGGAAFGGKAGSERGDARGGSDLCKLVGRQDTVSLRHRYPCWYPYWYSYWDSW